MTNYIRGHWPPPLFDNPSQFLLLADTALCLFSFTLANFLRFGISHPDRVLLAAFFKLLPWAVLVRLPIFIYLGFYYVLIRHLDLYDLKR